MLIDTHVHIYHERFDADRHEAIQRAFDAGVERMVLPAIDVPSIHAALELCERYAGLYAMSALHPSETGSATERDFEEVRALCDHPKVVAVGETGLDYYWDRSFDAAQHASLRRHIRLAMETDLPLVLHNREAGEDLVRILREEIKAVDPAMPLQGIFHCFGGPSELVDEVADLGFHYGLGGTLTFKNSGVDKIAAALPVDRIVLETDAPFLAPVPYRGKRNEPAYLPIIAEKMADVMGLSVGEVARITTENAEKLFGF
ncbi:MAG: TatD family hydrolase [Rhodothermia bacterium]|nr:TatD family hydrolase [Rhodothermia bacterium]